MIDISILLKNMGFDQTTVSRSLNMEKLLYGWALHQKATSYTEC